MVRFLSAERSPEVWYCNKVAIFGDSIVFWLSTSGIAISHRPFQQIKTTSWFFCALKRVMVSIPARTSTDSSYKRGAQPLAKSATHTGTPHDLIVAKESIHFSLIECFYMWNGAWLCRIREPRVELTVWQTDSEAFGQLEKPASSNGRHSAEQTLHFVSPEKDTTMVVSPARNTNSELLHLLSPTETISVAFPELGRSRALEWALLDR